MDIKLAAVKSYRAHLHDQYVDRSACWALQELSRDSLSGCLVVLLDGIDQQKFAIPRDKNLRASAALNPAKLLTTTLIFFDHLPIAKSWVVFALLPCTFPAAASLEIRSKHIRPCLKIHGAWAMGYLGASWRC